MAELTITEEQVHSEEIDVLVHSSGALCLLSRETRADPTSSVDSLDTYTRRPDCFGRAAKHIRTQCAEIDMEEDERVKGAPSQILRTTRTNHATAAIAMTLCELSTAKHYSPPLECSLFLSDSDTNSVMSNDAQSNCVE